MARYIDANKLIANIQGTKSKVINSIPYERTMFSNIAARQVEILDMIDNEPTADVVEVVHGEWTLVNDGKRPAYAHCSACGGRLAPELFGYGYCGFCGAKMDGKKVEQCQSKG